MKRFLTLSIFLFISIVTFAQTQQGIVKTRGRMVNGQLIAGTKLSGATITLNFGNSLVSGNQGAFSFNVPTGKNYSLVSATKQGYTLADPEYTRRTFSYSASNPFYVVLEDENQRQADINAATRKVRRTLTAQLQAREDEIEALKEQNKLTEEEYQERLKQLYDNQSKSEQLVKEMAERYASTDYDQLDEFNRQVQMYIEEGELQKADSMIRSKGDIEQRVAEYHNVVAANKKVREELEQSENGATKTYEDLSQDLLRRSDIFLQAYLQDSALYYLKMRADLDTMNADAVRKYAFLSIAQKKYADSEKYYTICLRLYLGNNDAANISAIMNNLGVLYFDLQNYEKSMMFYKSALDYREKLFYQNPEAYRADLASTQLNLGALFYVLKDYDNCEKYYQMALVNTEQQFNQNQDSYRAKLILIQNNLGSLYCRLKKYKQSESYHISALKNIELLFNQNPNTYREGIASTHCYLGYLYYCINEFTKSEKYLKSALENIELLFGQNPDKFREDLASTQHRLGVLYYDLHDYVSSEKFLKLALENRNQLFNKNPDVFREDLASTQHRLGLLYLDLHDYIISEIYFKLAIDHIDQMFNQNPDSYREEQALINWNIMILYETKKDVKQYESYLEKTQKLYMALYDLQPEAHINNIIELQNRKIWQMLVNGKVDEAMELAITTCAMDESNAQSKKCLAYCFNDKAYIHANESDFENANKNIDIATSLDPSNGDFYDSKGEILLMQGKNEEALAMWKKVIELNPNFLDDYPEGTELSNGLKKLGLIQ